MTSENLSSMSTLLVFVKDVDFYFKVQRSTAEWADFGIMGH